jgi:hypothetical protein
VLPVLHAAEDDPSEKEDPALLLDAKVDTFFFISLLLQAGQTTPSTTVALRTSSSNWLPHSLHTNSNNGMFSPQLVSLDGQPKSRALCPAIN